MRTSVEELTKGIGRWVARFHNRHGYVICHSFSNISADDAEDRLVRKIAVATQYCDNNESCDDCMNVDSCTKQYGDSKFHTPNVESDRRK